MESNEQIKELDVVALLTTFPEERLSKGAIGTVVHVYNNNFPLLRKGVSRMKRIDSSFQCCIRDGSRSAAYVMQLRCANHLKVLCSKGMVLNIRAKGSVKTLSGKCKEAECK